MDGLDDTIRLALEKTIDRHINDPKSIEKELSSILIIQGIEPNLETNLSFLFGIFYGMTISYYASKYSRYMYEAETSNFLEIIKIRSWELRQAIMRTRIGK